MSPKVQVSRPPVDRSGIRLVHYPDLTLGTWPVTRSTTPKVPFGECGVRREYHEEDQTSLCLLTVHLFGLAFNSYQIFRSVFSFFDLGHHPPLPPT